MPHRHGSPDSSYEPIDTVADRIRATVGPDVADGFDLTRLEVPLFVEPRPAGGMRLSRDTGDGKTAVVDVLVEIDPACRVTSDGPSSFGRVVDLGSVVDGREAVVRAAEGDGTERVLRVDASGVQAELVAGEFAVPGGTVTPLGATTVDDRVVLAIDGVLVAVSTLDDVTTELPAEQPNGCVRRQPIAELATVLLVEVPNGAYVTHDGAFDPLDFTFFGLTSRLIEVVDGVRIDLSNVPESPVRDVFGTFSLGSDDNGGSR